jgi:HTH-type transcriptional regulator/antitoxin HigA
MTYQAQPGELLPGWSIHPGKLLKRILAERNLRQSDVAERAGISAKHLNQLVNESIGITGDVAVRLERALGIPALFWTRAEAEYQAVESTRKSKEALKQHITWVDQFDRPTLLRNDIIHPSDDDATKVDQTLKFFKVATPDAFNKRWERRNVSFRRSQVFPVAEQNTALWLRLVERSAEHLKPAPLNMREVRKVAKNLPAITNLSVADGFLAARTALAHAGVVLTFVREVPDTRMNAATWWLDGETPIIGMTERHRRPDIFWFNLAHELGHVIKHQRRVTFLDIDREKDDDDPAEKEADEFAGEMFFPGNASDLIAHARSRQDLVMLATHLGVGVSVVAGRYARLTKEWKAASSLRGKITDTDITKLEKMVAESRSEPGPSGSLSPRL